MQKKYFLFFNLSIQLGLSKPKDNFIENFYILEGIWDHRAIWENLT